MEFTQRYSINVIYTIDAKKGEIVLQPLDISIQQFNEKRKYDTFRVLECAMEMFLIYTWMLMMMMMTKKKTKWINNNNNKNFKIWIIWYQTYSSKT